MFWAIFDICELYCQIVCASRMYVWRLNPGSEYFIQTSLLNVWESIIPYLRNVWNVNFNWNHKHYVMSETNPIRNSLKHIWLDLYDCIPWISPLYKDKYNNTVLLVFKIICLFSIVLKIIELVLQRPWNWSNRLRLKKF